jgi:hypothetical protein
MAERADPAGTGVAAEGPGATVFSFSMIVIGDI